MSHIPSTFAPLNEGWTLTAVNPEAAPEALRATLAAGIPATVPGEATLDLLNAGLIDDPFDGDNENKQQWIGDVDWRFTCRFDWQDDGSDRHDLVAYGLDTIADIALNGRPVASTRNFHRSYRWDVRGLLRDGANELTVTFTSPVRESDHMEQARGYYPHTEHHAFNQIRKPSYSFGWDWGIDVANAGIWREIGIDSWSGVRIASVRPLVDVTADGTGLLNVHVEIERAGKGRVMSPYDSHPVRQAVPVHAEISGFGTNLSVDGVVAEGRNEAVLTIAVPEAKLWWPVGYGDQPLYDVDVTAGDAKEAFWNGHVGFRTVHVDTRADNIGRPFQIYVNDVPVHAHGYNWIPDDAFISRVSQRDYERGIRDLVESNSNMVRAWGGGIYESDEFYDLCDREGILVMDETPAVGIGGGAAVNPYKEYPLAEHHRQVLAEMIHRDKNHPCVVLWSLGNEPDLEHFPQDAYDYWHPLYELAHQLDPQDRPVTLVCCQNDYTKDITTRTMDIVCINRYYGWYNLSGDMDAACYGLNQELDFWAEQHKPVMMSEYGADTVAGLHTAGAEMFSEEFQVEFYRRLDAEFDKRPWFVGEFVWNFADYDTVQGPMRVDGNKKGLFTRDRRPKLGMHFLRQRWAEIPTFGFKE